MIPIFAVMLVALAMNVGCKSEKKKYMIDNASIINDDVESYVEKRCDFLAQKTGAEIVIKTVKNTGNSGIDIYSDRFFEEYKIGNAKKENGVLFLMSVEEGEYRITIGKGLSGIFSRDEVYSLLRDSAEPFFSNENYNDTAKWVTNAIYVKLCGYYGIDYNGFDSESSKTDVIGDEKSESSSEDRANLVQRIFVIIVLLVISVAAAVFVLKKLFRYSRLLEDTVKAEKFSEGNFRQRENTARFYTNRYTSNYTSVGNEPRFGTERFTGASAVQRHTEPRRQPHHDERRYDTVKKYTDTVSGSSNEKHRRV